jgi:hypothetical protein
MARRIDVELTSVRDDGSWTWRAAGAKQPKGVLDADILYPGAQVGDIVRAEADFEVEGITIVTIFAPKAKKREAPTTIDIVGTGRTEQPLVTSSLLPQSDRPRGERPPRRDGERGGRREGGFGGERRDASAGGPRPPRREGDRPGGSRADGPGRRGERPAGSRGDGLAGRGPRGDHADRPTREPRPARQEAPAAPKPKKLVPGNVHRAAVLESLPPEHRPIAEQVLRGGIPAVRQAVETQNAELRAAGQTEVQGDSLLTIAEQLLPRLKAADWRDRAEAAAKDVEEIALRDLRSVVTGADVARDDEARLLASTLREALDRRLAELRDSWVKDITVALDEGRLVRALRVSARPPDSATRFPPELSQRLAELASAAMSPETAPDRWLTLIEAVAASPVRRSVKPAGLPTEPGEALLSAAAQASGSIPALAGMLGIDMPPPPRPVRPGPASRGGRPPARSGRAGGAPGGGPPRPPKPTKAPTEALETPPAAESTAPATADAPVVDQADAVSPEPSVPTATEAEAAVPATAPAPLDDPASSLPDTPAETAPEAAPDAATVEVPVSEG